MADQAKADRAARAALPGRLAAAVDAERVRDGVAPAEMLDKLAERLDKLDRLEERVSKVLALQGPRPKRKGKTGRTYGSVAQPGSGGGNEG